MRGPRRADPDTDRVDERLDQLARASPGASTGSSAPTSSTRSARVNAALSISRHHAPQPRAAAACARLRGAQRAPPDARRGPGADRAHRRATPVAAAAHDVDSGLAGRVAFCAAANCCALGAPSTTTRLLRAHSRSRRGAPRPRLDVLLGDAGDLGHPGKRVHRRPFHAQLGVQLAAQGGLIDDSGGFGFVKQRLGIDRHQRAVGAGLAVGHDHVSVQVRVSAARGLVLVGDRHQTQAAAASPSYPCAGCAPGCIRRAGADRSSPR